MLSRKVEEVLFVMEKKYKAESGKFAAVNGARKRLEAEAKSTPCLGCPHADFLVSWGKLNGHLEWVFRLAKCGGGVSLALNDDGVGLVEPNAEFCSAAMEPAKCLEIK